MLSLSLEQLLVIPLLLAGLGACGGDGEGAGDDRSGAPPPDLVLVVIDTWRWDALGANVGSDVTPELDDLARRGVRFSRAFATAPWTLPSVASTLTGHFPSAHGAYGRYQDAAPIRPELPTLAQLVSDAGYRTAAVTSAPFLGTEFGFDRGFEAYRHLPSEHRRLPPAGDVVDIALELAGEADDRPLFLMLHVFDPHLPLDPPRPFDERWTAGYSGDWKAPLKPLREMRSGNFDPPEEDLAYLLGLYQGEVAYTSRELGRFFERYAQLRPGRESLLVVTADHGEEFGEHGGWEHGHAMYRELVQIPLIVVPPSSWAAPPATVDAQVSLVDLLPTFLEAAAIDAPQGLPGTSLAPLVRGETTGDRPALSEREHLGPPTRAYRNGSFALIENLEDGTLELYDQLADPREEHDLAAERPELVEQLRRDAEALFATLPDLGPRGEARLHADTAEQLESLGYLESEDDED